jgi:hypothetical protein
MVFFTMILIQVLEFLSEDRGVALEARTLALGALEVLNQRRTLLLEELSVGVVVLHRDGVLLHHVVVHESGGTADGEASSVCHAESLGHDCYYYIH